MRNTTFLILLLTIVASSYTAACCAKCVANLKDPVAGASGEGTLPTVTIITGDAVKTGIAADKICGATFTAHGRCCDQTTLAAHNKAWIARLKARYMKFRPAINKYRKANKTIEKILVRLEKMKTKFIKGNKPDRKTIKKPAAVTRILGEMQRLLQTTKNSDADFNALKQGLIDQKEGNTKIEKAAGAFTKGKGFGKCFIRLTKIRTNALCLRCSGAATAAFNSDTDSYKLKDTICPKILEECAGVYAVIAASQKFAVLINDMKFALTGKSNDKIKSVEISEAQVKKWINCGADAAACSTGDDKAALCQTFGLAGEPNSAEEIDAGATDGEAESANTSTASRLLTSIKTNQRVLQAAGDSNGFVQVDANGVDLSSADYQSGVTDTDFVDTGTGSKMMASALALVLAAFLF